MHPVGMFWYYKENPACMNRFNSFKQVQLFNAHSSNQKKENEETQKRKNEKEKRKKYPV